MSVRCRTLGSGHSYFAEQADASAGPGTGRKRFFSDDPCGTVPGRIERTAVLAQGPDSEQAPVIAAPTHAQGDVE
jgi:hypothetical protein